MDLLTFSIIQFSLLLGLFATAFVAGWVESNRYKAKIEKKQWHLIHRTLEADREYWIFIDTAGLEFQVSYGMDNCVLRGFVPHAYIGVDNELLSKYIVDTYIKE